MQAARWCARSTWHTTWHTLWQPTHVPSALGLRFQSMLLSPRLTDATEHSRLAQLLQQARSLCDQLRLQDAGECAAGAR